MEFGQIIAVLIPVVVALLGLWRAHAERKGKNEFAKVIGAVIDGVETMGDAHIKKTIAAYAAKVGVTDTLNKSLDDKGYRRKTVPWKSSLSG